MEIMRTFNNYGVEMDSITSMKFHKYIDSLPFGMNTKTKEERFEIANDFNANAKKD